MSTPSLPEDLRARILARAAATPAPTRTQTNLRLVALIVTAAVWLLFMALAHGRRSDWDAEPGWMLWVPLLNASLAAVVVTSLALARGRTLLGPRVTWLLAAVVVAPVLSGTVTVASVLGALGSSAWLPRAMELRTTVGCDVFSVILALPVLGLFLLSLRGRTLPAPGIVGAAGGVCAASWAHAVLTGICPWNDPLHIILGHAAPAIPLAVLGAWAVRALSRRANRVPLRG